MADKFCLKWNDFQANISSTFRDLRKDGEFSDVTLACEDGQQVKAHKVILAASSPFFKNILQKNKHPHPLIYMRGIKMDQLVAIIDFLYYGETNVFEENVDNFFALAEEMKLKGLSKSSEIEANPVNPEPDPKITTKKKKILKKEQNNAILVPTNDQDISIIQQQNDRVMMDLPSYVYNNVEELDYKVKSMMIPSENMIQNGKNSQTRGHVCTACGKEGLGKNIKDHIEAKHIDGVSIPCNICEKRFRSRKALRQHNCKAILSY